jgi:signal transduction histidine kinase
LFSFKTPSTVIKQVIHKQFKPNIRFRITLAIASTCIAIVTTLGIMLYIVSENMEAVLVDQLISEQLNLLVEQHEINPNHMPASTYSVQYYIVKNDMEAKRLPSYLQGLKSGQYETDIGNGLGDRNIAIRKIGEKKFIVVYNIGSYEDREKEFRQLIVLSILAVICIALPLGYFLSRILTHQLTELSQRVTTLTPNSSTTSLYRRDHDPEIATLAKALDQYRSRTRDMIRREQEFTANASHELRTPLTAIRTSCELLAKEANLNEKTRVRIGYISQAATHMTEHIQALLLLAREKEPQEKESIELKNFIEEIVSLYRQEILQKKLVFENHVSFDEIIEANRQVLRLVVANLIKNAVSYTEDGFVRIEYNKGQLVIIDSGVGIPNSDLPHIFERNYRVDNHGDGLGVGLEIVKRICHQANWTIKVDSAVGKGSKFALVL